MHCREIASFDVVHRSLAWPWIAIDPTATRFAFASSDDRLATRVLAGGAVEEGPSFSLPADLRLPEVHAFGLDSRGELVAALGASVLVTLDEKGERVRSRVAELAGGDFVARAVTFDRTGSQLWVSAESGEETALIALDARTHAVAGVLRSAKFPPPASHELHPHPSDDAVLLLAACGEDGTFARVAAFADGRPVAIATALDAGAAPAGFVGFSADGARVHLAEDESLRTHAWPSLDTLSSAPLTDGFYSSYSGAVLGGLVFVDGELERDDGAEEAVMIFDRAALTGSLVEPPAPPGMWVGRLGATAIVTVEPKGDPARGRVLVIRKVEN